MPPAARPHHATRKSIDTPANLNSLVNCLRDNPMTQFSFEWILSLNWLCQKWGQVQYQTIRLTVLKAKAQQLGYQLVQNA